MNEDQYDWIVIGSGFGGSVSALRLMERGYRVLLLEKGRRFGRRDFPRTNWNLRNWMWTPSMGLYGFFQMSFLKHITVVHGVGVGGGSLVYANTLPTPNDDFFEGPSWSRLADWKKELEPHYDMARFMLGATENPIRTTADEIIEEMAVEMGRSEHFHPAQVGVFFGEPGEEVPDPYFGGKGPDRVGCTGCGACMTGCRVGAKNTLDQNYLYLAEQLGLEILAETEVTAVRARAEHYVVEARSSTKRKQTRQRFEATNVVFAGGVMGTMPLMLKMREDPDGLPGLSERLGDFVRTNSEALIGVVSPRKDIDFSKGLAITSILHTDAHSHMEACRYASGSGFFRTMIAPHAPGHSLLSRFGAIIKGFAGKPLRWLRAMTVWDFAKKSLVLLYMRTLEGTLSFRLGRNIRTGMSEGLVSHVDDPEDAPQAFMEEATELAERFARKVDGVPITMMTETLLGVPSTAHILGGACMGDGPENGVIDHQHRVFGYDGLYVIDGSSVSANPGVNPSLTITALAERAMSLIPHAQATEHESQTPSS